MKDIFYKLFKFHLRLWFPSKCKGNWSRTFLKLILLKCKTVVLQALTHYTFDITSLKKLAIRTSQYCNNPQKLPRCEVNRASIKDIK
jgi:hypothetical protein